MTGEHITSDQMAHERSLRETKMANWSLLEVCRNIVASGSNENAIGQDEESEMMIH